MKIVLWCSDGPSVYTDSASKESERRISKAKSKVLTDTPDRPQDAGVAPTHSPNDDDDDDGERTPRDPFISGASARRGGCSTSPGERPKSARAKDKNFLGGTQDQARWPLVGMSSDAS